MITIKFEAVTQSFYGRTIFQDINAELRSGTITAVTGQNGSGKSTLLKLAARFMLPAAGQVSVWEEARELRRAELRQLPLPKLKAVALPTTPSTSPLRARASATTAKTAPR